MTDKDERIQELEEKRIEFILNESMFQEDENPSWGEVLEAQIKAATRWQKTDEGKELISLLNQ